ncbi:MAG: type I methionyl aminopeptidase, partial [Vicinamibacteria bacterium]
MIRRRDSRELEKMHQANAIVLRTLEVLERALEPGITTAELDRIAAAEIAKEGAVPAFKGYRGFPASLCVSVNDEVVHGIPSSTRKLAQGDVVSLDLGAIVDGYYGDNAITAGVGEISPELERLLAVAEEAMYKGIEASRPGNRISDIGYAVSTFVERHGFSVVRDFVGHGIGRALHEDPPVPNFVQAGRDPKLTPGICLAIEPMVNLGSHHVKTLSDRWTVVTMDGSVSAHFERSVAVTDYG